MTSAEQAFANLLEARAVLDELGIVFWLDGGSLLGVWRDGDFPPDDEDDIDLCAWVSELPQVGEVVRRLEGRGFRLYHRWERQIAVVKDGYKVDLFFYERAGVEAWCCVYERHECIPNVVPLRFLDPLASVSWRGVDWLIPNDTDSYLSLKYGDWRTPVHRSVFSCYSDQNGTLRRGWSPDAG